ncbi:MAG: LysR family transcriptional regulator [Pseudomonadota bacterium]
MRLKQLDLNQLICMDALLSEKNVSRAAERLNLSQPAISWTLAKLREYFEDPLLVRVGRSMTTTPFADSLARPVRDLLLQAQAIAARRPEHAPAKMQRDITLVASDYVSTMVLQDAMRRAALQAPGVRVSILPVSEFFDEQLDAGEVDLLIASMAAFSTGHPSEKLLRESYSCIAALDHPILQGSLSIEQYYEFGHVAVAWGRGRIHTHDQTAVDRGSHTRRNEVTVSNFSMVPGYLVGTRRLATIQARLAQRMATQWPLQVLPCPLEIPDIEVGMQWNKSTADDPALVWFRKLLKDICGML